MNHVPDWRPWATREVLAARATMLAAIRAFFAARDVLEVETPLLSRAGTTDPALASLTTRFTGPGAADGVRLYLHTSPEFPMKRLLAAGSGPIWQVCKVFRDGERGRRHHPEFSLLEWYRPGFALPDLMDEVAALIRAVLGRPNLPMVRVAYRDLFRDGLGLDPFAPGLDADGLRRAALARAVPGAGELHLTREDGWLDLLLTHCLEPDLGRGRLTFLTGYPPSQAALARIDPGPPPVAERFECYLEGIELANGFRELTDAAEQRARFTADIDARTSAGLPPVPMDEALLAALATGLPDTSGVALGLDRLLMLAVGASHIDEVLAFPLERA